MSAPKRLVELEALRGVGIAAVVGLHTSWNYLIASPGHNPAALVIATLHLLCGIGVPLFVVIATIGLAQRYSEPFTSWRSYGSFLGLRARRLLPAYVAWSLISIVLRKPELLRDPVTTLEVLLLGTADAQFYFVPLIFQLYLLWPVLRPLTGLAQRSLPIASLVLVAGTAISVMWWSVSRSGVAGVNVWSQLPFWMAYITFGIGIGIGARWKFDGGRPPRAMMIAVAAVLTILGAAATLQNYVVASGPAPSSHKLALAVMIFRMQPLLYAVAGIGFLIPVVSRWRTGTIVRIAATLGRFSYGIFLSHLIVLHPIVHRLLPRPDEGSAADFGTVFSCLSAWLACLLGSFVMVRVLAGYALFAPFVSNQRSLDGVSDASSR